MRLSAGAFLLACSMLGCHADVPCPGGRELRNAQCVCPQGEDAGQCLTAASPDPSRDDADGAAEEGPTGVRRSPRGDAAAVPTGDASTADAGSASDAGSDPGESTRSEAGTTRVPSDPDSSGAKAPTIDTRSTTPPPANVACDASCASQRCSTKGVCLTEPPKCGDGHRDADEECDDENELASDDCFACRKTFCGDSHLQPGVEECEIGVTVGLRTWNHDNCSGGCKRTVYTTCDSFRDCNNQPCVAGVCSPTTCPNERLDICPLKACPLLPEYAAAPVFAHCLPVPVRDDQACPSGLARVQVETGGICVGRAFSQLTKVSEILEVSRAPNEGFVLQ